MARKVLPEMSGGGKEDFDHKMQEDNTMHYKYTDIKAIVAEILENKKDKGGVKNIYFVGTCKAHMVFSPA